MEITEILTLVFLGITLLTLAGAYVSDKKPDKTDVLINCICYNLAGAFIVLVIYGLILAFRWISEHIVLSVLILGFLLTAVIALICIVSSPYHEIRTQIKRKKREWRRWLRKVRRENEKYNIDHLHVAERDGEQILHTYDWLLNLVPAYHLADPKNDSIKAVMERLDGTQCMIRKLWQQFLDLHACGISDLPSEVQEQMQILQETMELIRQPSGK